METTEEPSITFAELAGAYAARRLSETTFLILLSLVRDLPPWWNSRPEDVARSAALNTDKPYSMPIGPVS